MEIDRLLEQMVKFKASDLHLQEAHKPGLRLDGSLRRLDMEPLSRDDLLSGIKKTLSPPQFKRFTEENEGDGSYQLEGAGRFRINAYVALNRVNMAIRHIPLEIPKLESLHLPAKVPEIALSARGLILVTGVTGSGKSTSLAAMIRHVNENRRAKIITLEDPVEFLHTEVQCSISQREVGIDTVNYSIGLKQMFRQNPDVILLGEIRDAEVMSEALAGAETGHLVLSTLHTADARHTITRVLSFYPPHDHPAVREVLSGTLVATLSMRLLPKKGGGRVPAVELMTNTALISDIIAEEGRLGDINKVIADGRSQYGMQTFDQCILDLFQEDLIEYEVAKFNSTNPSEFDLAVQGITGGAAQQVSKTASD